MTTRQRQEPNWAAREALGINVRAARTRVGWSQEDLAHASGVARSYVSTIERGLANLALDHIVLIANTLGVDPLELVPDKRQIAATRPAPKAAVGKSKAVTKRSR